MFNLRSLKYKQVDFDFRQVEKTPLKKGCPRGSLGILGSTGFLFCVFAFMLCYCRKSLQYCFQDYIMLENWHG